MADAVGPVSVGQCLHALSDSIPDDGSLRVVVQPLGFDVAHVRDPITWTDATPSSPAIIHTMQAVMIGQIGKLAPLPESKLNGFHPPETREGILQLVRGADLWGKPLAMPDQVVEGLFASVGLSSVYGASNSGKSFLMLDMACAIARGIDWLSQFRTEQGAVLYLASEGPRSVQMRLQAYQHQIGAAVPNLYIAPQPVNLFNGALDTQTIIDTAHYVEDEYGLAVRMIIGDTLATISAGANENHGEDMGLVFANAEHIVESLGTHLSLIHHIGKDDAKGMRGWSGMKAKLDTEVEVIVDELTHARSAEFTKQRDLPTRGRKVVFELFNIELDGKDNFGNVGQSCVVVTSDKPAPERKPGSAVGGRPKYNDGLITGFLGSLPGASASRADLVKHFANAGGPGRSTIYRALDSLIATGDVSETAGLIRLAKGVGS